jgi:hypothetical protein
VLVEDVVLDLGAQRPIPVCASHLCVV